ncbi:hypothetical protein [Pseudomonas fluorescens]|uniref:hypothetical protein n=1 Tax=Pseudomonas fluorescens TaxID=294 RepID=UPI0005EBEA1D|nr:hypothetical protein [Pseudomonas fluorescens]
MLATRLADKLFEEFLLLLNSSGLLSAAALIEAAPSNYRVYLRAKFQQQNNKAGLLKESGKTS